MKTLKLFSALVITGFLTMSMGFPTDLADKKEAANEPENPCQTVAVSAAKVSEKKPKKVTSKISANFESIIEDEPVQALVAPVNNVSNITLKVFDVNGKLVVKQDVSMNEFLGKSRNAVLPSGSTFVMFHNNTAYYFLEAGLAQ